MNEKWKTLLISVLTPSGIFSGVSLTVLWGYFSRMDRLDVFFEVININSIFSLIFFAVILSLGSLIIIFFVTSILMAVVIPQDVKNLPDYDKIKSNLFLILIFSGLFPMVFIFLFYYVMDVSQALKNYSAWISMLSIGTITILLSFLTNRKRLEKNISIKNSRVKWKCRIQFYLAIPLFIALLAHLQVFPLEVVFRNMSLAEEKVSFWPVAGLVFISYMVFFLTLFPGLVYHQMRTNDKMLKKLSVFFIVSLLVLLMMSTKITFIPVMFTHAVIKFSGISDFTSHSYVIKESEYPEELFGNPMWQKKAVKVGQFYTVQAVSLFTTNQINLLCPKDIVKIYRESWKFNPWNRDFDTNIRLEFQKKAFFCVPLLASAVKRWDSPLQ